MTAQRTHGWEQRLVEYLGRCQEHAFEPGVVDCGQFAAGAVLALTGRRIDLPTYSDVAGALSLIQSRGWQTLRDACRDMLGDEVDVRRAQRGDVVWMPWWPGVHDGPWPEGLGGLGVLEGAHVVVPGTKRLVRLPLESVTRRGAVAYCIPVGGRG